ncbi:type I restriction-modification system subunit M N-terminal domain-containing protein [Pontibacter diazotrophicus]|uniref:type I restriction-modification system subunit M N-terminal domain-containing protein n=1 Tax=Pontibacter diazotrophicus TaxID=1400979 RepID=UPI001FE567FC|nr:type I restriction-modification system subunit M N-terminal domain-containing protein [Pontibacter diazotrophicus]
MKNTTPTAKPKADIDFENELWNAANELRGAVAENQYKDYVLSLLFVKHLSERYEVRKQELQLSFFDPESDYYNVNSGIKPMFWRG